MTDDALSCLQSLAERLERVSASHAERFSIRRDDDWHLLKLHAELGELTEAWLKLSGRGRRVGTDSAMLRSQLGDEAADLLCQLLVFSRRFEIDLGTSIRRKWLLFDPIGEPAPVRLRL